VNKEKREEKFGKSWPTITLVPSSKLVCVVKCWNSFNIVQSTNISSLSYDCNTPFFEHKNFTYKSQYST